MEGIKNLLTFLNNNWTVILICIGAIVGIVNKTINYFSKSKDERVEIAKKQIEQEILKMISDAESEYKEWEKAGEIKRSEVIGEIFKKYPILSKVVGQKELIQWIDDLIDNSLDTLRDIISQQEAVQ
jgi:hypothetical protein